MQVLEAKKTFLKVLLSTIGVTKLHQLSFNQKLTNEIEIDVNDIQDIEAIQLLEFVYAIQTDKGWNINVAISLLDGVPAKFMVSQLQNATKSSFAKLNAEFNKLTVIIKGVTYE
ncbi:hypothetical protein [Mycoplasmopsis gallopavonis]|uniref:Uncharacterized protein n=1 Tax=Mycoplasmopsis gallopavonis TaxID=76629 RepID=A0A449AYP9_9BACT|nr:hypothetical protein [Mycoplasmopsis gallopavonis]RIV16684.1 hypothetical protein D1113_01415 [Mycoplasmopsis gallopavonis]VEU72653.1 Uncharacterised protein [Mycoplasmopsis gallopavonis]